VQWTRSRDGLGGVLRKALGRQQACADGESWAQAARHLLLVEDGQIGRADWLRSHPPLQDRIRRLYGRSMPALPMPVPQPMRID
jgi:Zn-dependent protease with chaperone function